MAKFACVVVVDADNETAAFDTVSAAFAQSSDAEFIGGPWPVRDRSEAAEYDTHTLFGELRSGIGSDEGFAVGDLVEYCNPGGDLLGLPPYKVELVEPFGPDASHWRYVLKSSQSGARIAGVITSQLRRVEEEA
jgi:hypothetical protein